MIIPSASVRTAQFRQNHSVTARVHLLTTVAWYLVGTIRLAILFWRYLNLSLSLIQISNLSARLLQSRILRAEPMPDCGHLHQQLGKLVLRLLRLKQLQRLDAACLARRVLCPRLVTSYCCLVLLIVYLRLVLNKKEFNQNPPKMPFFPF